MKSPKGSGLDAALLRRAVHHAVARAAPGVVGDVSVVVVGDRGMRVLNRRYRGKDAPTDVLAFPLGEGRAPGEPFGDIVISHETARRQARTYGGPLEEEMLRLALHGALHLCGHDHHERKAAARMRSWSQRILAELRDA